MNNMQLWLISSTDSINLNSAADGYYLNPDLDGLTGLPSIRSSNGVNAGYDGGWTSTQLWDARLITIRGLIVDKDGSQVELKRKALSKLVGQGKKEPLTLKFVTEFGRTYTCTVRTTNCTMALQNIFTRQEYQIQLRADDPLIYDDGGNDVKATLRVTEDNAGFEIPFDIPLDISGGADPVVVDAGEDTNYPLITMYGELHSPTIVNQTTNQQLQLGADLNGLIRDWNETDTASGNSFQITNSTEYDAPITDFKLDGNTEQTGTPTPDSPQPVNTVTGEQVVKITGKNLFDKDNYSSTAGYFYSSDTLIGTGSPAHNILFWIPCASNTKYSITIPTGYGIITKVATSSVVPANGVSITGSYRTEATVVNGYTTGATAKYLVIYLQAPNYTIADILDDIVSQLQLELGSTATAYEPYQGQTLPVNLTSKNLFDGEIEQGGFTGTGLNNPASNRIRTTNYIPVSPNTEYSIKVNNFNTSLGSVSGVNVSYYAVADYSTARISEKGWQTASGDNVATFTTPANCHYIRFLLSIGSTASGGSNLTPSDVSQVQLEKGDSVSSYEAYWKIELAEIGTYQDRIHKNDGKWYIEKQIGKHTLDGSENFGRLQIGSTGKYYFSLTPAPQWGQQTTSGKTFMSDHFTPNNTWAEQAVGAWLDVNLIIKTAGSLDGTQSVADFKTWLGTHNTTVYYALATATDTAITESALITQLNAIVQASLPVGLNNVSNISIAPNLAGEMVLTYGTGYIETPPDMAVIDCKDRTVSINGVNAFNLLADGSEFIRLEPGENKLYLTSETQSDSGYAEVKFKTGNLSI